MKTIAIIGAGSVGKALGERLLATGVAVRFGVRDPVAAAADLVLGPRAGASVHTTEAATAEATLLLLAVPAAAAIAATIAAGDLRGKVVLDCTNPIRWDAGPVWNPPPEGSVTAALAAAFPDVPIIKGFNHFGAEIQANPDLVGGPADAFFAGDSANAKAEIMELARRMGFRPYDAGPLRNAALLENLAMLWIHLATVGGQGRRFGLRQEAQATAGSR